MNFQFNIEKLFASEEFKNFIKENKDAYPCSGFVVTDLEKQDNKTHFDYYIPSVKKMFSFKLEDNCAKIEVEQLPEKEPEKLKFNYNFSSEDIQKLVEDKMAEENIKNKIQKLLFSLQCKDGKDFLIGTVFISGMGMLKVNINIEEMKITEFEKRSFMDMVNVFKKKDKDSKSSPQKN